MLISIIGCWICAWHGPLLSLLIILFAGAILWLDSGS